MSAEYTPAAENARIRVALLGASGKMGRHAVEAVTAAEDTETERFSTGSYP